MVNQFVIIKFLDGSVESKNFTDKEDYTSWVSTLENWYLKGRIEDFSTNGVWASELPDLY